MITVVPSPLKGKIKICSQKACLWAVAANAVGCRIEAINKDSFVPDKNIFDFADFLQSTGIKTNIHKTKFPEVYYTAVTYGNEFHADQIENFILIALVILSLTKGESRIYDIKKLSPEISDKLYRTIGNLKKMGADIITDKDSLIIYGKQVLSGADVSAGGDSELFDVLLLASLRCEGNLKIKGFDGIDKEELKCLTEVYNPLLNNN